MRGEVGPANVFWFHMQLEEFLFPAWIASGGHVITLERDEGAKPKSKGGGGALANRWGITINGAGIVTVDDPSLWYKSVRVQGFPKTHNRGRDNLPDEFGKRTQGLSRPKPGDVMITTIQVTKADEAGVNGNTYRSMLGLESRHVKRDDFDGITDDFHKAKEAKKLLKDEPILTFTFSTSIDRFL
jgi:hypothetical protein